MGRKYTAAIPAAVLAFALVLSAPASARPHVQGKLTVEGIVAAVNNSGAAFTIQVINPGRANRTGSRVLLVLVQQATELRLSGRRDTDGDGSDAGDFGGARRRASIADIRVGDRVKLEGFRLDDGRILALRLQITNRAVAGPAQFEFVASGVVTSKGANSLVILANRTPRAILITPSTEFRGQRNWFGAVQPGDFVMVGGTVNADGSVVARRVETTISGGTTLSGQITLKSSAESVFLILNHSIAVNVASDTQITSFGQIRSLHDLQVGQTITVTGSPIVIGGVTVAINARTITF